MQKLIVGLLVSTLSTVLTIWVMVSGWGLTAKSWSIIIWGAVLQFLLIILLHFSASEDR